MNTDSIVERFVHAVPICKASTDSFNDFATKRISELIASLRPIHCCHHTKDTKKELTLSFSGGTLTPPVMLEQDGTSRPIKPQECRLRNITYASPLYIDVLVKRGDKSTILRDVYFGKIPIMIYSYICHLKDKDRIAHDECPNDPGGYFIIHGMEKSLVGQKAPMYNRLISYKRNNSCAVAVKSEKNHRIYVTTLKFKPNTAVTCTFPRLQDEIPVMYLLLTLGNTMEEIRSAFSDQELVLLAPSFRHIPENPKDHVVIREVYKVNSSKEERLQDTLENLFLPHMEMQYKSLYVIHMIKELLAVSTNKIKPTDRDSVANQRVEMSCTLLSTLFLHLMIKTSNDLRLMINKYLGKLKNITDKKLLKMFNDNTSITDGFQYAMSTGNWNTSFVNRTQRVGVAQALQRLSQLATISQLRRISSAINSEQKLTKPRYLHGSHWGRYCPAETPEGMNVGLETQLSIQAYVSLHTDPKVISKVISQFLLPKCMANVNKGISVYINGIYEGNTNRAEHLVNTVRKGRRSGQFSKDMSVSLKNNIHISTTAGRICRPLLICDNGVEYIKRLPQSDSMSWNEMLTTGIIEYLDCEEEDTMLVAFRYDQVTDHTHSEIDCAMINGVSAACIPYSDRNPAPRNTYQSAMGKQAQGVAQLNFRQRYDTTANILQYTQKPLVSTKLAKLYDNPQAGFNAVVCVCPFMGYGQEDSIIVNQYALDRGMARADHYKTIKESTHAKEKSVFQKPSRKKKFAKYHKLDVDGLVKPGTEIQKRDAIIGKTKDKEDISILSELSGRIDSVLVHEGRGGDKEIKSRIRTTQIPTIGDKFSSRHGQKGTIGLKVLGENLPFNVDGISPDIIVNPHAFPSRMTVGHWLEMLTGKTAALSGKIADASPFNKVTVSDIAKELKKYGFQCMGNEVLIDGITGEMHTVPIFMGCIFYQRLKHMVDFKIHARGRGRRNALTGQPNDGRSNGGGLRVGEMEKDSMNSHGVPYLINERMLISSDAHEIRVCPMCKNQFNIKDSICTVCKSKAKTVQVPYAANLLMMELQSMCINTKIKV